MEKILAKLEMEIIELKLYNNSLKIKNEELERFNNDLMNKYLKSIKLGYRYLGVAIALSIGLFFLIYFSILN